MKTSVKREINYRKRSEAHYNLAGTEKLRCLAKESSSQTNEDFESLCGRYSLSLKIYFIGNICRILISSAKNKTSMNPLDIEVFNEVLLAPEKFMLKIRARLEKYVHLSFTCNKKDIIFDKTLTSSKEKIIIKKIVLERC